MVPARAAATVLGIMGMLAAVLAVTGIFGMASYSVSRCKADAGTGHSASALGAQRIQVLRSTLARPVLLLLCGSGIGLVAGVMMSQLLAHLYLVLPHRVSR